MNKTISIRDAARLAGVSLMEIREHAEGNDLYPHYTTWNECLDKEKFFRWLDPDYADKEREYAAWVEANGDFLRRFLRENVE